MNTYSIGLATWMFYIFNTHNDKITLTTVISINRHLYESVVYHWKATSKVLRLRYMVTCLDRTEKFK